MNKKMYKKMRGGNSTTHSAEYFGKESGSYSTNPPSGDIGAYGKINSVSHGHINMDGTTGPNLSSYPNASLIQTGGASGCAYRNKQYGSGSGCAYRNKQYGSGGGCARHKNQEGAGGCARHKNQEGAGRRKLRKSYRYKSQKNRSKKSYRTSRRYKKKLSRKRR